jgi:hypothetical protein
MSDQTSTDRQQMDELFASAGEANEHLNKQRIFRTALPAGYYIRLEAMATLRGTSAFKMAGAILKAYLDKNAPTLF